MMVGGMIPLSMAIIVKTDSIPPEPPRRWPVIDFVELMGILCACSPKARLIAVVSSLSFNGVEVPWALM